MEQVEGLLEELPTQTKIHCNLWTYLPVILEIERGVILLERNQGVTERQIHLGDTREQVIVSSSWTGASEDEGACRVGKEGVGGVLIVEFSAKGNAMTPEAPGSIVLDLTDLDDTALWEV